MANCLIGLGSNLGDRGQYLRAALDHLQQLPQTRLLAASTFHDTKPAGGPTVQSLYLNAAARIETSLEPLSLLAELQRIENELGRVREQRWGPRTVDLDLLLYDTLESQSPDLTLPHPRMSFRRFVLEPAAEIAADMVHPINGWTIGKLLDSANKRRPLIYLTPGHSKYFPDAPATSLLKSLQGEPDSASEPEPVRSLVPTSPETRTARWLLSDRWPGQTIAECNGSLAERTTLINAQLTAPCADCLVVVVDPASSPHIRLLDTVRRLPQCGPVLWIPGVPLAVAQQEVFAAMAAME
jgi:2-amino-4-hydroxy-6-hydroxymethyldihydropteridine diphosphokinase